MKLMETLPDGNVKIVVPIRITSIGGRRRVKAGGKLPDVSSEPFSILLARAFRWQSLVDGGRFSSIDELAATLKLDGSMVRRTIRLTLLSPEIIHGILNETIANGLNIASLRTGFPVLWEEQKKFFGL